MAKKKRRAMNMPELARIVTDAVSQHYDRLEQAFDNVEEPFMRAFKVGAEPMVSELKQFVSKGKHYRSGDTLESFNPGVMEFDAKKGIYNYKFGFDMNTGGFPALILEYGDVGSPMRMPNEAYYFIYWASRNHVDGVSKGIQAELDRILKKIEG